MSNSEGILRWFMNVSMKENLKSFLYRLNIKSASPESYVRPTPTPSPGKKITK